MPYVVSFVWAIVLLCLYYKIPEMSTDYFPIKSNELFSATLTLFGVLLGFLATTKALLLGMASSVIEKLTKDRLMSNLIDYISAAIWGCLVSCMVNIGAFFIDKSVWTYQFIWYFTTVLSFLLFIRVTYLMLKMLKTHYELAEDASTAAANNEKQDILDVDVDEV